MRQLYDKIFPVAVALLLVATAVVQGQNTPTRSVGIGTPFSSSTFPLNPNAVLHLEATDANPQGLLIPRLNRTQFNGSRLESKDNGLLIYDLTDKKFYYWLDNTWVPVGGEQYWQSSGTTSIYTNRNLEVAGSILSTDLAGSGSRILTTNASGKLEFLNNNSGMLVNDGNGVLSWQSTAGGDLTGSYPNPTVTGLNGKRLNTTATPSNNQVLIWDGANNQWTYQSVGGDVTGTLSTTKVTHIQNRPVANITPNLGQVLGWTGSEWAPTAAFTLPNTGNGDILVGNGTNVISRRMSRDATMDSTGAVTVQGLQGKPIHSDAASLGGFDNGKVLTWKWDPNANNGNGGGKWTPADVLPAGDLNASYILQRIQGKPIDASAASLTNNINDIGKVLTWRWDATANEGRWTPVLPIGERIQGKSIDVTAAGLGTNDHGKVLTWDGNYNRWTPTAAPIFSLPEMESGQILIGTNDGGVNSRPMSGDATMDAEGLVKVQGLRGTRISDTAPSHNHALIFNGSEWAPTPIPAIVLPPGDLDAGSNKVKGIQGSPVAATPPAPGQVLVWNNTSTSGVWEPANPSVSLAGDVSGSNTATTVQKIRGKEIDGSAASLGSSANGQVLTWEWNAANNTGKWTPKAIPPAQTISGDATIATNGVATVTGLQGKPIHSDATLLTNSPNDNGKVLTWEAGQWTAKALPGGSGGGSSLENQTYSTPQTRYYSIDPTDFVQLGSGNNMAYTTGSNNVQRGTRVEPTNSTTCVIAAALHLPHGATVTEIKFLCYDDKPGEITCYYVKNSTSGGYTDIVSSSGATSISTSGTGGPQSLLYTTNDEIDNENYSYKVVAAFGHNDHKIYGVRIKYTVEKPD